MNFFMRPLVFFPLTIIAIVMIITFGLEPQRWPQAAHPVDGVTEGRTLVLSKDAFDAPSPSPEQHLTVHRSFWGDPQSISVAIMPDQPPPTPAERGVRILLSSEAAASFQDEAVVIEVDYTPLGVNPASGLAVSLQGIAPADWVIKPLLPEPGTVTFELPAQIAINAIGLRAMSEANDQIYGVNISAIRMTPARWVTSPVQ